jgi:hypothetical protein
MPPEDLQILISALTKTPEAVDQLVRELSEPDLRIKNSPEEFSVVENVCHLRDIEIEGYTTRISRILSENNPLLPDIDGSRLAVEREYHSQNLSEALQAFTVARNEDAPDLNFDGYNFWVSKLNQFNGNFINAEMVKAFLSAGEYRRRFGRV